MNNLLFQCTLLILLFLSSCHGQKENSTKSTSPPLVIGNMATDEPIAHYIRNIHQDKHQHLWFGTNGLGVAHYDGNQIQYYSIDEGFHGEQVTGIAEDKDGNLWFSTNLGVVHCKILSPSERNFTHFKSVDHFGKKHTWSILYDSKNRVWLGTSSGIYLYKDTEWKPFPLPISNDAEDKFISQTTTWSITEDKNQNIWFSTNGHGVFKYDGLSFTHISAKEGLSDNSVDQILEDSQGVFWIATRFGGLNYYDGEVFEKFSQRENEIGNDEVCVVFEDRHGNIWFSSEGFGVYKYDGERLMNYGEDEGLEVKAVQTIYEDNQGRIYAGGGGGLFRLENERFIHISKNGPW